MIRNAMDSDADPYDMLASYTISLRDPEFIHQLVVDAYAAQQAGPDTKPIKIMFALVGLYLANEKGYTGKRVQDIHVALAAANHSKQWPVFAIPTRKAAMTIRDVIRVPDDRKKEAIRRWSRAVWQTWKDQEPTISGVLAQYLGYDFGKKD